MKNIPKKQTDEICRGHDVSLALARLKAGACPNVIRELEQREPVIGSFITGSVDALSFNLTTAGCPDTAVRDAEAYMLRALLVIYEVTRAGHRRLLEPFLPNETGEMRPPGKEGK